MQDFQFFMEHNKVLFDACLYEDVKIISDLLIGLIESKNDGIVCDHKDKYTIYFLFGNSAFNLKEYKLAESLFNKALQMNKSNLRSKTKSLSYIVKFVFI